MHVRDVVEDVGFVDQNDLHVRVVVLPCPNCVCVCVCVSEYGKRWGERERPAGPSEGDMFV
jgi:hypothetical protein